MENRWHGGNHGLIIYHCLICIFITYSKLSDRRRPIFRDAVLFIQKQDIDGKR